MFLKVSVGLNVLILFRMVILLRFIVRWRIFLLFDGTVMELMKLFTFLLQLFSYHRVVFLDLVLEMLTISDGLLDFLLQICLVLYFLAIVSNKLFGQLFDLISLALQLLDRLALDLDHLLEIVALGDQIRDSFLVVSLVSLANLDQNVQSLMLK